MKNEKILAISGIVMAVTIVCASFVYAEDPSDVTTGPGVGLSASSWDGQGKIYTMGKNDVVGDYVSEANALEIAPTTVESNILNPINNYAVDMGPTTANNWQLQLQWINDNGPGQSLDASVIMPTTTYNNVGPGANLPKATYQDNGPMYEGISTANIDPANALNDYGPASSTEYYARKHPEKLPDK